MTKLVKFISKSISCLNETEDARDDHVFLSVLDVECVFLIKQHFNLHLVYYQYNY